MSADRYARRALRYSLLTVAMLATVTVADRWSRAQAPPASPSAAVGSSGSGTLPGGSNPSQPAGVGSAVGPGGGRIGAAEVSIVGGNIASARERALTEALKQAVDQALTAIVPDARTTQPKVVTQVLGRARGYVRRYRTIEEGERGRGLYGVRIEAEVDEGALQRAFDRPAGGTLAIAGSASASGPSYLLVASGVPEAIAAAGRAFTTAGARVQPAGADLQEPGKAVAAAGRAGLTAVAFVSASATADGKVRGPGVESVTCAIGVRVLSAANGLAVADESETVRSFAADVDKARADCFERAAGAAIPRVVPTAAGRSAPDVRTIVLDTDIVEPGAVPALVKQLRGIGSVSAIEVRRIAAGRVELWVRSRLAGPALAAALGRDASSALAVNVTEVTGDLIRARVRLREVAPAAATAPTPAAAPSIPSTPAPSNPGPKPTP